MKAGTRVSASGSWALVWVWLCVSRPILTDLISERDPSEIKIVLQKNGSVPRCDRIHDRNAINVAQIYASSCDAHAEAHTTNLERRGEAIVW